MNNSKTGLIKNGMKGKGNKLKAEISKKSINFIITHPEPNYEYIPCDYPDKINIEYYNDINLIKIHELIRNRISELLGCLDYSKNKIIKLKNNLKKVIHTKSELTTKMKDISELENEIINLESGNLWENYIREIKPILELYIPLMSDESKKQIILGGKKQNLFDEPGFTKEQIKERLKLINEFISLIKRLIPEKYLKIECNWTGKFEILCPCGESYNNFSLDEEKGVQFCKCGIEKCVYFNNAIWESTPTVNTYIKSEYEGLKTFKIAWLEHQGRSSNSIPDVVFEEADKYFTEHQIGNREYYANIKCDKKGRKPGTSIQIIIDFMKNKGFTQYYNLYNIFGRDYFGWTLPDYTHLDNQIYEAYQITQSVYDTMERERKFNINNEARQCLLLLSFDVEVSFLEDFKAMSRNVIIDIQKYWYSMCEGVNFKIKYVPIIK